MASTPVSIVEEWRRKNFEFSKESDDLFSAVVTRGFEVVSPILKNADYRRIKHALFSLDFELSNSLSYEIDKVHSIRSMMYGMIQAFHLAIVHLMEKKGNNTVEQLSQTKEGSTIGIPSRSIVEKLREKCFELSRNSDDLLLSVFSKGFEVVSAILKDADHRRIKHALSSLAFERSNSLSYENEIEPSIRSMMYGTIEAFHLAIVHLMENSEENVVEQLAEGPNDGMMMVLNEGDKMVLKEGDTVAENMISGKNAVPHKTKKEIKEEEIRINEELMEPLPMMDELPRRIEVKSEIFDDCDFAFGAYNGMSAPNEVEESERALMDSDEDEGPSRKKSKTASEKRRGKVASRSSRAVSKPKRYHELEEDCDEDERPPVKRSRSVAIGQFAKRLSRAVSRSKRSVEPDEQSDGDGRPSLKRSRSVPPPKKSRSKPNEKKGKANAVARNERAKSVMTFRKENEKELACPECEFRTTYLHKWLKHLEVSHATSPALAGLLLRCDCGFETTSVHFTQLHAINCNVAQFTIVRKRDGPIRRFNETLKCIMCEKYPKTAKAYADHLYTHKSSLLQNGITLKCACGYIFTSAGSYLKHDKKCDGNEFTLHNIEDE